MECAKVLFSGHAVRRMYERGIEQTEVFAAIRDGEVIMTYPDKSPFPGYLVLSSMGRHRLHVVVSREDETGVCIVVTVYRPDPGRWSADFRRRRRS